MLWGASDKGLNADPAKRPQIDGLRAVAVMLVLHHHFWIDSSLGYVGVRLFFVISGFLITGILLDQHRDSGGPAIRRTLAMFYARRALRIFPAYYALLFFMAAFNLGDMRQTFGWHALYLSNALLALSGEWSYLTAHLWSLSVEEQFYLLWPLAVLTTPYRHLKWLFATTVAAAVMFRCWYGGVAPAGPAMWVLTPTALDALAVGALLALFCRFRPAPISRTIYLAVLGLSLVLDFSTGFLGMDDYTWRGLTSALPMAALVYGASVGMRGPFGWLLETAPFQYIGRISYGIYLYHFLALGFWEKARHRLALPEDRYSATSFFVCSALTVLIASGSWYLLERPINHAKQRFPYRPTA